MPKDGTSIIGERTFDVLAEGSFMFLGLLDYCDRCSKKMKGKITTTFTIVMSSVSPLALASGFPGRTAPQKKVVSLKPLVETRGFLLLVIAFAILLLAVLPARAAVTQQLTCNDVCMQPTIYGVEGVCLLPTSYTVGLTPYVALTGLCPQSQTCYCKKEPGLACNDRCKGLNYTTGNCEIDQAGLPAAGFTTPGYGYVSGIYRNPDVLCTSKGAGYSCICRKASAELQSAVAGLNVAFVWPSEKNCKYIGGEGNYLITLSGTFGGASGLRIDLTNVPAAPVLGVTPFTPISSAGAGVPPATINGFGWFLEMKKVPASSVEQLAASQGTTQAQINVRYTTIPPAGYSQIQSVYTQSFASNYPTSFGTVVGGNTFEDFVICETPEPPAPVVEREPIEGPAQIKINSIVCTSAASVYENTWNLVDFRYSDANAFHFDGNKNASACTFTFSGTQDLYGIEARANGTINISSIAIGRERSFNVSMNVSNVTSIAFADYNLTTPRRSNVLTVNFEYTGSPALLELNPFPDVISIDALNVTPLTLATGDAMVISGTVSDHAFSAGGGLLHDCVYEWEGGCYPCIGRDCTPSATKPIGKPNWAFVMPFPWAEVQHIECFFLNGNKYNSSTGKCDGAPVSGMYLNKTPYFAGFGVKLTPPMFEYAFDIALEGQVSAEAAKGAKEFWIEYSFRNLLAMSVIHYVNLALNDWNKGDARGEWAAPALIALATTGLAPLEGILDILQVSRLWGGPGRGMKCLGFLGVGGSCGLLGWAIGNQLNETGGKECKYDPKENTTTCVVNVPFIFFPWWDLESVPEPDPDKKLVGDENVAGGYYRYDETCPPVSGTEKWLFNAGWWTLYDFLGDMVSSIQRGLQNEHEQTQRDKSGAVQNCDNCLRGTPVGTATYTEAQRNGFVSECQTNNFDERFACFSEEGYSTAGGAAIQLYFRLRVNVKDCDDPSHIFINSSAECSSKIPTPTTLVPGKWCAKPIDVSGKWYHSKDRSVKYGGYSEEAGKCVLSTDSCDVAGFGIKEGTAENETWAVPPKGCGDLENQTEIGTKRVEQQLKETAKTCQDCAGKEIKIGDTPYKGVWCYYTYEPTVVSLTERFRVSGKCAVDTKNCPGSITSDSVTLTKKGTIGIADECLVYDILKDEQAQDLKLTLSEKQAEMEEQRRARAQLMIDADKDRDRKLFDTCPKCLRLKDRGAVWCANNSGTGICTTDESKCYPEKDKSVARSTDKCDAVTTFALRLASGEVAKEDLQKSLNELRGIMNNINSRLSVEEQRLNQLKIDFAKVNLPVTELDKQLSEIGTTRKGVSDALYELEKVDLAIVAAKVQADLRGIQGRLAQLTKTYGGLNSAIDKIKGVLDKLRLQSTGVKLQPLSLTCEIGKSCTGAVSMVGDYAAFESLSCKSDATPIQCSYSAGKFTLSGQTPSAAFTNWVYSKEDKIGSFDVNVAGCGDGKIDENEQCDSSASTAFRTGKDTCQKVSTSYMGGTLKCTTDCTFDTSACTEPPKLTWNVNIITFPSTCDYIDLSVKISSGSSGTYKFWLEADKGTGAYVNIGTKTLTVSPTPSTTNPYSTTVRYTQYELGCPYGKSCSFAGSIRAVLQDPTGAIHTSTSAYYAVDIGFWSNTCTYGSGLATASATASELSQLGSIPEAPGTAESFGSIPTTGAAIGPYELLPAWMKPTSAQVISSEKVGASPSGISSTGQLFGNQQIAQDVSSSPTTTSSFGSLAATGMQLGGVQGNSLMMQYIKRATGGFEQMWMSISELTNLATGKTLYRRTYTVQPGLDPQCPTTDPVNSRGIRTLPTADAPGGKINQAKAPVDTPYYESTSQYYTSEGEIRAVDAPVYITIYKAGIWKDSQIYTPTSTGLYNWSVELRDVLSNQIVGNATSNFTAVASLPIGSQPSVAVGPVNVTLVAPMSGAIVAAGAPQMLVWNSTVTTGVNVTVRVDNTIQYRGAWNSSHAYTPAAGTHDWSVELVNATSGVSIVNVSSNFTALATNALPASGILRLLSPLPGSTVLINEPLLLKWNSTVTAGIDVIVKVNGISIYSPGIAPNCLNITQPGCWPEPTTDCYVPCQDIPVIANYGEKGVFRYLYSPHATGSYRVEVHTHGGSVGTLKNATFTVQNRTGAGISALPSQICGEQGKVMTLAPVLTQPTVGSAMTYTASVTREPSRASDQAGLVSCLDNGTCSRAATLNVTLQPNQTMALALESNVSDDTTVKLSVRDVGNVYGLSAQQSFLHKIVERVAPSFSVASGAIGQASATTPGQSFDFQLQLTNNIAQGCTPTSWFLTKEAPGTGWGVWFNSTTEAKTTSVALQGGMTTGMTLHVLPTAFNAIDIFPIYVLASEAAPARLVDTQLGTAAVVTATDGSKLWYAGADKKIRSVDVSTGAATEIGTVSDSITGITADWGSGGNIYWISGGAIRQSAKTTFTPTALVSGLSTAARNLVVYGNTLYWTDGDAIKTASKAATVSCGGANCTLLNDVGIAFGLAVDSMNVYWSGATDVWRASKGVSGNLATAMAIGTAGFMWTNKYAVGLAAGAAGSGIDGIYATLAPDANAATGKVVRLNANGTADDIFSDTTHTDYVYAIAQDFPKAVAIDKDWVYWIDRAGDVWRTPSDVLTDYVLVQYDYDPGWPSLDPKPSKAIAQAGTTVTYTLTLNNSAVVQIGYNFSLVNAPPANWTVSPIVPASGTLNAGASVIARINVTSPTNAQGEFTFNVSARAPNSNRVSYASLIYNISNHTMPGVVAELYDPASPIVSPGKAVRWQLNITNRDPAEYATPGLINLSVANANALSLQGWVAQFCKFTDAAYPVETCSSLANSLTLTVQPNTTNSSILLYVQSPKQAADGPQNVTVRATLDGLHNETTVTYTVFGCGNGICDPERGEYDLNITTGGPMCGALGNDCNQGYHDFQCYFSNSGLGRTWLECDRTGNKTADFGTRVAQNITDLPLTGTQLRVCYADRSIAQCLAPSAAQCGILRDNVESPDVTIGNCVAQLTNSTAGVGFGPLFTGSVQCPADAPNVAYYLLYFGRNGTAIQTDGSTGVPFNWTSANFTFSCPSYGVSIVGGPNGLINHPIFGWKKKLDDCQRQYDIYAAAYGPGSVCAQVTLRACNIRRAHLENLTAVLTRPQELGVVRAQQIVNSTATLDAQLDDAALRCAEVPALGITGITLPSTKVGEIAQIRINVSNMLDLDYRGYAECKIILPDGSQHTYNSTAAGCTNFTANSTSVVSTAVIPVALTQPGVWNVTECTVWAESVYLLPASQCSQAATRFSSMSNIGTFTVIQSDFQINSPAQGELVKGAWPINVRADGYFDGIDWALSSTSESCNGSTWSNLTTTSTEISRSWTGTWNSSTVADATYWMCFRSRMAGFATLLGSLTVDTDNWAFIFNPVDAEIQARARTSKTYDLTLRNTGTAADNYNITCTSLAGWTTTMTSQGRSATCPSVLSITVSGNQTEGIAVTTSVPNVATGTTVIINFTSRGRYDVANATQKIIVSEIANDPPQLVSSSTIPTTIAPGGTLTFRARVSDPDGDNITTMRACRNADCSLVWCNLTGAAVERTCSAVPSVGAGTYDWWVYAEDALGLSRIEKASAFTISQPTVIQNGTQQNATTLSCTYTCMAACVNSTIDCKIRTDYGQRNCSESFVCCREAAMPNCAPSTACAVIFERANCVWDPVALNYSVNAQVAWSAGVFAKISAAGTTSGPLSAKPAVFSGRVLSAGTYPVAATVYSLADEALCTNSTTATCVRPGTQPAASSVSGALPITSVSTSSSRPGNEANKATDGDQFTAWRSQAGMPQWLKVDLGISRTIGGVGVYSTVGRPLNFTVGSSLDDVSYSLAATVRNASYTAVNATDWNVTMFSSRDARYVLINVTETEQNSTYIYEVQVYPGAVTAIPLPITIPAAEFPMLFVVSIAAFVVAVLILLASRKRIALWWSFVRG